MKKYILVFAVLLSAGIWFAFSQRDAPAVRLTESKIQHRFKQDGINYVVHEGDFYKDHQNGTFSFVDNYFRPDFLEVGYVRDGDAIYVQSPDDPTMRIRTRNEFRDDFESYDSVQSLVISEQTIAGRETLVDGVKVYDPNELQTRWMAITLQSPKSPSVNDYVEMRKHIQAGGGFVDNRVEPTTSRAHSGKTSIRFESVAPSRTMVCAKSSLSSSVFYFGKGDDFCFSGWFYFEKGMPLTVMDLESTWLKHHSGIRIMISEAGHPCVELKAFEKPIWRNSDYVVPRNQWVNIKAHFLLDEKNGTIKLWIDDNLLIDQSGQTLPLADSILDSVEVGVSATLEECVFYLDDVVVSGDPDSVK